MKLHKKLIKYELVNYGSNLFGLCYSFILPLGLALLFALLKGNDPAVNTTLLILFSSFIPMATMFGYAGNYAAELENGVAGRMKLFGYSERTLLSAKVISNLIYITVSFVIYFAVLFLSLNIQPPSAAALITLIIFLYVFSAVMFVLMHAVATLCGSYSTTYGMTFILLAVFMLFSGIFGASVDGLPQVMQVIGHAFPTFYITKGYLIFWNGGGFDFLPFILSTAGLALAAVCLMALAVRIEKKRLRGKRRKKNFLNVLFKMIIPFGRK